MVFGVLSAAATSPLVVPESVLDEAAERVKVYVYKERGKKPSLGEPSGRIYWQLEGRLVRGLPRTSKASEATHFWIPHALMAHWRPPSTEARARLESYYRRRLRPTLEKVLNKLPYFNKSRDAHLFAYAYDLGPVCEAEGSILDDPLFQQVVHGSRVVGYHARDAAFDDSLAASVPRFGRRPKLRFGARRSCWGARDVAVPQFNKFHARGFSDGTTEAARGEDGKWVARLVREAKRRKATFFFRGQIVTGRCSATVRFWLARYCATRPWCASDGDARSAVFAPAPGGWGCWSSRFYDAVDAVTIPVRLADGLVEPFARLLNYSAFVRTLETGGDRETLDSDGLAAAFDAMHAEATAWRRDCAAAASSSDDDLCLSNPLSRTMRALALARPFLGWDDRRHAGRNAFALFLADLYLRHNRSSSSLPMVISRGGSYVPPPPPQEAPQFSGMDFFEGVEGEAVFVARLELGEFGQVDATVEVGVCLGPVDLGHHEDVGHGRLVPDEEVARRGRDAREVDAHFFGRVQRVLELSKPHLEPVAVPAVESLRVDLQALLQEPVDAVVSEGRDLRRRRRREPPRLRPRGDVRRQQRRSLRLELVQKVEDSPGCLDALLPDHQVRLFSDRVRPAVWPYFDRHHHFGKWNLPRVKHEPRQDGRRGRGKPVENHRRARHVITLVLPHNWWCLNHGNLTVTELQHSRNQSCSGGGRRRRVSMQ